MLLDHAGHGVENGAEVGHGSWCRCCDLGFHQFDDHPREGRVPAAEEGHELGIAGLLELAAGFFFPTAFIPLFPVPPFLGVLGTIAQCVVLSGDELSMQLMHEMVVVC